MKAAAIETKTMIKNKSMQILAYADDISEKQSNFSISETGKTSYVERIEGECRYESLVPIFPIGHHDFGVIKYFIYLGLHKSKVRLCHQLKL